MPKVSIKSSSEFCPSPIFNFSLEVSSSLSSGFPSDTKESSRDSGLFVFGPVIIVVPRESTSESPLSKSITEVSKSFSFTPGPSMIISEREFTLSSTPSPSREFSRSDTFSSTPKSSLPSDNVLSWAGFISILESDSE